MPDKSSAEEQSCCACLHVSYAPKQVGAYIESHWECDLCGSEFTHATRDYAAESVAEQRGLEAAFEESRTLEDWRDLAWGIHEGVVKAWKPSSPEDIRFLALSLGGECGELSNILKKAWRGDFELKDRWAEVGGELADIRVYLELLARAMGYDLDACVRRILPKLERRWPEAYRAALKSRRALAKEQAGG